MRSSLVLLALPVAAAVLLIGLLPRPNSFAAAPSDVSISALSCDTNPEYVRITNFGGSAQSLSGFHIQSDPSQDYDIGALAASISAGQTLEFQSGTNAANGNGTYRMTGSFIYRNGDATDYARLARSDATADQVNCGTTPTPPTPAPTPVLTTPVPTTPAPTTPVPTTCGEERWPVKTLSDLDAGQVDFTPQGSTVDDLRALTKPGTLPENNRILPTEETTFRVMAFVKEMKLEDDHDIHLVIGDLNSLDDTMIVEFPDVTCDGAAQSAYKAQMAQARQQFIDVFGQPSSSHFTLINGVVIITGVGFFDVLHGQLGVAPNGIELHPVLSIAFAGPATPTTAPTPTGPTPVPTEIPLCDVIPPLTPAPGCVGTPTPTPRPTSTGVPRMLHWGDLDCSGVVDAKDGLARLAEVVGVTIPQAQPCPKIGTTVTADGVLRQWGAINCVSDNPVNWAVDIFLFSAGLDYPRAAECPDAGDLLQIVG